MRLSRPILVGVVAAAAAVVMATPAFAAPNHGQSNGRTLPTHLFAPYFESFNGDNPATIAGQSGARFLTMAFLQTAAPGSCTVDWNGDPATPVAPATFGAQINQIRATGGDVIPSFGGFAADDTGTELADSCASVPAIAAAYENVITTYHVTRLDLDTEDNSLTNTAGIDRRNKAIRLVEDWATAHHRTVQFTYTLPTTPNGLAPTGLAVLQNAVANHARIDIVNIMTFDYYDDQSNACQAGNGPAHEMGDDTVTAAGHLLATLRGIYPHRPDTQLWRMIGITEDVGRDDFGTCETFTTDDAHMIARWAISQRLAEISFWSIQRDTTARSHVPQTDWQFSQTFEPVTSNRG
jgi:glycosyl hydrolase family 18 (putative chitinase)